MDIDVDIDTPLLVLVAMGVFWGGAERVTRKYY